ncbi:right-handed parallel beta-helix repeat-containing protein [Martelella limonii]|uniref:right-handed parallel beta-helix repeat-containing protein n=1 Tax=Martelella limonii TaxID=1647649 RepID=UPI001581117E
MSAGGRLRAFCGVACALLLALAAPASAIDHARLALLNRDADTLSQTVERDEGGVLETLSVARQLLDAAGIEAVDIDEPAGAEAFAARPAAASSDLVVETALLGPLLQAVALETGNPGHRELIEAASPSSGQALVLKKGAFTLASLLEAAAGQLEASEDGYRLKIPLFIAEGASLDLAEGDRLELATERGAFIVNEGYLSIAGSVVEGSATAARVQDFHPFILTVRGGRADISDSVLSGLGFDGQPLLSGLSFATSRFAGRRSSGAVTDTVLNDIRSVEATGIADFRFENNRLNAARGIGLRLERVDGGMIRDNVIAASGQHGLLMIGTRNTVVAGNVMASNAGRGIFARDGVGHALIAENVVIGNGSEGMTVTGAACIDILGNAALRNRGDGIAVAQSLGTRIESNLLLRNQGAGISLTDAISPDDETRIAGNLFFANVSGISAERFARMVLSGNDLSNQLPVMFAGALQYETPRYLTFKRNQAEGDAGAFSISAVGAAAPSLFKGNRGQFRLADFTGCDRERGA